MLKYSDILNFFSEAQKLKTTLRYIYLQGGKQESTAEHSWQLCLMVPIVTKTLNLNIDVHRALMIALVHDLPEAITGDIDAIKIAKKEISKEEKNRLEVEAIKELSDKLPESSGQEILNLWQEYEAGESNEAKFIKALDKIETVFQLANVSGFWEFPEFTATYPDAAVKNCESLLPLLKEVKLKLKDEFIKKGLIWKEEFNYGLE